MDTIRTTGIRSLRLLIWTRFNKTQKSIFQTPDFPIPTIFWAYLGLFEENHQILTFFLENVHKMFIKVHIMFFISGHNSDNRYKKPSASYLNKVQQNAKVHISNSRFSHSYHILSISWAFWEKSSNFDIFLK